MIKALSKVDKFIKQTQLLKEHKLVYELFAPSQFEQSLLTIPSLRWRVILCWRKAPWPVMDCRMDQVTWLSFIPWCCFQPSFLRLGSIIFYKSWVPFYLIYCGICIEPDNFQKSPSLSLYLFCPETSLLMSLSTSRAQYSRYTELSQCVMGFVHDRQVTVSGLSFTLIKTEKSSVRGKLQHHFWALMGLYSAFRKRKQRLKTGVELPCSKWDLSLLGTCCMGTTVLTLGQAKGKWLHVTRQKHLLVQWWLWGTNILDPLEPS